MTSRGVFPAICALMLDAAAYAELAKPSSYVKPVTYGSVVPGLFDDIVMGRAPPTQPAPSTQAAAVPVPPKPSKA